MTLSLFDDPISGLITGGLGMDACEGLILAKWHLGPCGIVIEDQVGGSIPLAPGQSQNIYTPITNNQVSDQPFLSPYKTGTPQQHVKITVTIGNNKKTKDFFVPLEKRDLLIKIIGIVNKTISGYRIIISKIKALSKNAIVHIKNIRNKHDK